MRVFKKPGRFTSLLAMHLFCVSALLTASPAQNTNRADLLQFVEKRLFNEICPVETNELAGRVFKEYGSVYAADSKVVFPVKCIFANDAEVQQFQQRLEIKKAIIRGVNIELQRPAMDELLAVIAEANINNVPITPLDGTIAGRRNYYDTVRLWNSRLFPALNYWVNNGSILESDAEDAKRLPIEPQVLKVIDWERKGLYFGTNFARTIFSSTAPPGTSQHLAMLAFDVAEYANHAVGSLLNKHGWFQTIASDPSHFTFLGVPESELPSRGLILVQVNGHKYWIPNINTSSRSE